MIMVMLMFMVVSELLQNFGSKRELYDFVEPFESKFKKGGTIICIVRSSTLRNGLAGLAT
jgi:TRAP-type C4-dicarboxylate transport system permease large subunit